MMYYFNRKTQELSQFLRKNKWNTALKQQEMNFFSRDKWLKLQNDEKKKHSLGDCNHCNELYFSMQSKFPNVIGHRKKKLTPLRNITNDQSINSNNSINLSNITNSTDT